jgi:hypothetical protein
MEVHHLKHQADAKDKRNDDGTALNDIRNLTVLCTSCHDKEHAEQLLVGPVEDTSEGPRRQVIDLSEFAYKPAASSSKKQTTKVSEEELKQMKEVRQRHPALEARLLRFQIQAETGIEVEEKELKALMKKGLL